MNRAFRNLAVAVIYLIALAPITIMSSAEAIEGIWYGVLSIPDGPELRLAIVIRSKLDESFRAMLISIDQAGTALLIIGISTQW